MPQPCGRPLLDAQASQEERWKWPPFPALAQARVHVVCQATCTRMYIRGAHCLLTLRLKVLYSSSSAELLTKANKVSGRLATSSSGQAYSLYVVAEREFKDFALLLKTLFTAQWLRPDSRL